MNTALTSNGVETNKKYNYYYYNINELNIVILCLHMYTVHDYLKIFI